MRNKRVITTMMAVLLVILLAANGLTVSPPTAADDTSCIYFEDLSLGTEYHVGDTFTESGVFVKVDDFQWSNGQWTDGGYARVENTGMAGGSGQDMLVNNTNLRFDFGGPCEGLSLLYGEYGGNLNIEINGDFLNFNDFTNIDGLTLGGVDVVATDFGGGKGSLMLSGTINQNSFAIGGQELWIDDVCSEVQAAEKPDLIITDVWSEDSTICYQIRNTGTAVARAGHYTGLSIDGVQEMLDYIAVDLAPGERLKRCFDYDWVCTPAEDTIKVCGDYSDDIAESDEANNCREETWKCDSTPPRIVSGPTVSKVTTSSALVSWDTDEASDSAVTYDKAAGKYDFEKTASSLVTNHEIALTGLEPSTTYHFVVQSTDSSGNTVQSKDIAFETLPSPDYEDPVISTVDQAGCTGITTITAVVSDNIGVERVEFYLEGERIYTDYSPSSPHFELPWDPGPLPNGSYGLNIKALDSYGNFVQIDRQVEVCKVPPDIVLPDVWFTNPKKGDTVSGNVTVAVNASDNFAVDYVQFYIDDVHRSTDTTFPYTYLWNTQDPGDGNHTIMAKAYDATLNTRSRSIAVEVYNPPAARAILEITRCNVTRHSDYFTACLKVENVGTAGARNIVIRDYHRGFQCMSMTTNKYDVVASYSSINSTSCAEITYHEPLEPGEWNYIVIILIPILFDPAFTCDYVVGDSGQATYEDGAGNNWTEEFCLPVFNVPVGDAFLNANYLILTNPHNLFSFNPGRENDVNELLSAMAELAFLKNAVLGYFYAPGSVKTAFDEGDGLACGDVDNDGRAEIIVAEDSGDNEGLVGIYSALGWEVWVWTSFDGGDGFACGQVDNDDRAEIIVAEDDGGVIDIYSIGSNSPTALEYSIPSSFHADDGLACGDVDEDGEAEIIVANASNGTVNIYNVYYSIYNYGAPEYSIPTVFDEGDGLACGDVDGDGEAEIIVAKGGSGGGEGTIVVYNTATKEDTFDTTFDEDDGLACCDVYGDDTDEIIVAEDSGDLQGYIDIWSGHDQLDPIHSSFDINDCLACGDMDGDGKAEIIVAEDGGNYMGWIDMTTYGPSETGERERLSDLMTVGGAWSNQLDPNWTSDGYLLIVGETEIIPAWAATAEDNEVVRCTDLIYANTEGRVSYPELSIGRIIGNNAGNLTIPIRTSIGVTNSWDGYKFDRSDALAVCGTGKYLEIFENSVSNIADILSDKFVGAVIHWDDYFIASSFPRNYEQYDGFAVGDVTGDDKDEIIIGDHSAEKICIYSANGTELFCRGRDFEQGDGLAVGDVMGDDKEEIIIGDHSAEKICIYSGNGTGLGCFDRDFQRFDGLAAGDVTGDGKDEIVMADRDNSIHIFDSSGNKAVPDFTCDYQAHDGFAIGNVESGGKEEIIIGDHSAEKIRIYNAGGTPVGSFTRDFQKGDGLAAGDVFGDGKDMIVVGDWDDHNVCFYDKDGQGHGGKIHYDFQDDWEVDGGFDGFAVGNVTGSVWDQILIGSRDHECVDILDTDGRDRMFQAFNSSVADKDVIYFCDHCSSGGWSPALGTDDFPIDFGLANPLVWANCCNAGEYSGITGIAEVFLQYGAGVYVGATEVSYMELSSSFASHFFREWVNTSMSIGSKFKLAKRMLAASSPSLDVRDTRRHCLLEYQLYGDPTYGGLSFVQSSFGLTASTETEIRGPLSSLDVIVPDYEVTSAEGEDYACVEIPNGDMFTVRDMPLVPSYAVSLDYPQGYQVQDVVLTDRSGLSTATGLNIRNAVFEIDGEESLEAMDASEGPEWWPEDVFDWAVFENADGSTTLAIAMYPFYYNPLTTDVSFYRNYSFDIDYIVSTVEVSKLETDKHVYQQGEQVLVDLEINNSAAQAQDVLVEVVIEAESSGEIVGGLLLRTLKGLAGPASFSPHWDSTGFEPGYYYAEVMLKDTIGNVLDRETKMFRLGVCSGEIASLTATPEPFDIGDEIDISMAFKNIGTVDISGTALVRVQDESGDIVQEFSHEVTDLAPDDLVSFDDSWDTSGAEEGTYHISGLVFYDGQAAGSAIAAATTAEPSDEEPSDEEPSGRVCFIATAAYGNPMAGEIEVLREFRDEYLLSNPVGQALTDLYYRVSPPVAEFMTEHPGLKPIVRAGLLPAVAISAVAVNTSPAEKTAIVGFLVLVSVALALWANRRRSRGTQYA